MTFDEVIEEHRVKIGANRVHVSLGPDATPETLREELERQRKVGEEWNSFPIELRLRAEIEQLHERLRRICRLSQSDFREYETQHPDVSALKKAIFRETDIIALNRSEAIAFCRKKLGHTDD